MIDSTTLITIIVAGIAMIPGVYTLLTNIKKSKQVETEFHMEQMKLRNLYYLQEQYGNEKFAWEMSTKLKKPNMASCKYCGSQNTIEQSNCIQCGAPNKEKNSD